MQGVGLEAPGKTVSEALEEGYEGTWLGLCGLGWGPQTQARGRGMQTRGGSRRVGEDSGRWEGVLKSCRKQESS